ncbi:MAG: hypothetical protein PSX81_00235 [bacterium]|nr:hypothetical protein [bacterium]
MYKEIQKFKQAWIWVILSLAGLFTLGIFGYEIYEQIILKKKMSSNPTSDTELVVIFLFVFAFFLFLIALFAFARLSTILDKSGIQFRFFPFHIRYKQYRWEEIVRYEIISFEPLKDYGGWGIRYGKMGKAYTVSGNKGLQVYLKSGRRFLLGTQKAEALQLFLSENIKQ